MNKNSWKAVWRGPAVGAYPTVDTIQNRIKEYFDMCWEVITDDRGYEHIKEHRPATFAGLARYLGFSSRRELIDYANEQKPEYEAVIKDALLALEDNMEGKLLTSKGNVNGIIFALKNNARWEDTQQTKVLSESKVNNSGGLKITWANKNKEGDVIDAETLEKQEQNK